MIILIKQLSMRDHLIISSVYFQKSCIPSVTGVIFLKQNSINAHKKHLFPVVYSVLPVPGDNRARSLITDRYLN